MPKRACDGCSIRKIKCEGTQPCRACLKAGLSCTFLKALRKGGPRKPHQKTINQIQKTQIEYSQAANPLLQDSLYNHVYDDSATAESSLSSSTHTNPTSPTYGLHGSLPNSPVKDGVDAGDGEKMMGEGYFPYVILSTYLEIYHHRLYPVWPIVNYKSLLSSLTADPHNPEVYALAVALSGATMAQLQLPPWKHKTDTGAEIEVSADRFTSEVLKLRRAYALNENPNVKTILISMFLHVCLENKGNLVRSTLYLRETVTFIQLLQLDRESTYKGKDEEDEMKRRIFWLLFVTERGHHMVHEVPCVLSNSINLPTVDEDQEPLLAGFMALVQLFASFDKSVINAYVSGDRTGISKDILAAMQIALDAVHPHSKNVNEVQKADIVVTKHWMKTLIWQVSMSHGFLKSRDEGESMTLAYPTKIAGDLLGVLCDVSHSSIESHGPGMEFKLFEVTNSLADVILCVPTMARPESSWSIGPRDYLRGLVDLLNGLRGGNQSLLNIIKSKASNLLTQEPTADRVLELSDGPEINLLNKGFEDTHITSNNNSYGTYGGKQEEDDHNIFEVSDDDMIDEPSFTFISAPQSANISMTNSTLQPPYFPASSTSDVSTTSPRISEQTISDISSPRQLIAQGLSYDVTSAPWVSMDEYVIPVIAGGDLNVNMGNEVDGVDVEGNNFWNNEGNTDGLQERNRASITSWMNEMDH